MLKTLRSALFTAPLRDADRLDYQVWLSAKWAGQEKTSPWQILSLPTKRRKTLRQAAQQGMPILRLQCRIKLASYARQLPHVLHGFATHAHDYGLIAQRLPSHHERAHPIHPDHASEWPHVTLVELERLLGEKQ